MVELINEFARIELFSNDQSRKTPFKCGYRPLFNFQGAKTKVSGSIRILESDFFPRGTIGEVEIAFIKGMIEEHHFESGVTFTFDEGRVLLGKGEIK